MHLGVEVLHAGLGGFSPALMRFNIPRRYVRGLGNFILDARRFWIEPLLNGSRAQRIDQQLAVTDPARADAIVQALDGAQRIEFAQQQQRAYVPGTPRLRSFLGVVPLLPRGISRREYAVVYLAGLSN